MSVALRGLVSARLGGAAARCIGFALLLGSVAGSAEAGCANAVSGVVTCTGDIYSGAAFGSGVSELNVHSLTRNIRPATGDNAVSLLHGNPVVNVDMGGHWAITNDATAIGGWSSGFVTLDVSNARVATSGSYSHGVVAGSQSGVDVAFSGLIITRGEASRGIWGHSHGGGQMTFDIESVIYTTGDFGDAIKVEGADDIFVRHIGRSATLGENAEGFYLRSTTGTIGLSSFSILSTRGAGAGAIEARALQDVNIAHSGTIRTTGRGGRGVFAQSDEGFLAVATNSRIATDGVFGTGIEANGEQGVSVWARGSMGTRANLAYGIEANSGAGAAVVVSDLNLTTLGNWSTAILVDAATTASINNRGAIRTFGYLADGINAYGQDDVRVSNSGAIITRGAYSHGIEAGSANGNVLVVQQGALIARGNHASGIVANGYLSNQVNVYDGGYVVGGAGNGAAISLQGGLNGNLVINWGALAAFSNTAVSGSQFNDRVLNIGKITGSVNLGAGDDAVINAGLFRARGDSDFGGGGGDMFVNGGTFRVLNAGGGDVVRMLGLERFVNRDNGEIVMQDGQTGGRLEISGNFAGGGRLLVDASATQSDQVAIGGAVTGTTFVNVAYRSGDGVISAAGLPVIDVSAGTTDPSNFRLENGPIQDGLLEYGLLSRTDGVWTLVGSVTQQANTLLGYTSSGSYAWNATGDAWNDYIAGFNGGAAQAGFGGGGLFASRLTASRFTGADDSAAGKNSGAGGGVWFKMLGGDGLAGGGAGAGFASSEMTGYQAGADYNLLAAGGPGDPRLIAGVTFGTSNFSDDAHLSAPSQDSPNARNGGLYLAYADGTLDAGLLVKADYMDLVYTDTDVDAGDLSFASFGFQGQLGYSLTGPSQPWTLRVNTAMRFTQSRIDDAVFGNVPVSFGGQSEMVSTTGLTLSYLSGRQGAPGLSASFDAPEAPASYRFAFGANIERDIVRRHDLRIADYEALRDNELRTFLGLSARFDWHWGGLTAGGALNYHKGLTAAASQQDALSATVGVKHRF